MGLETEAAPPSLFDFMTINDIVLTAGFRCSDAPRGRFDSHTALGSQILFLSLSLLKKFWASMSQIQPWSLMLCIHLRCCSNRPLSTFAAC
jgi:hypothetical protein